MSFAELPRPRAGLVSVAATVAVLLSSPAVGQPSEARRPVSQALRLQVQGPCLEHAWLSERIERLIGGGGVVSDLQIDLTGRELPQVSLVLGLSRGNAAQTLRRLELKPGTCEGLREAVSLVIAMAIDAAAVSPPLAAPAEVPARPPAFTSSLAFSAGPLVPIGVMGDAFAVAAQAAVETWFKPRIALDLAIAYLPRGQAPIADGNARLTLWWIRIGGCFVVGTVGRRFRMGACGAAIGGRVGARGTDFSAPREGAGPWAAASAGADLRFVVRGPFELFTRADAVAALVRPSLEVREPEGPVAASRPLGRFGALVQAGLSMRFF